MKIAFVSQPYDCVMPPYQTSIGVCTYEVTAILARSCEVIVYGRGETLRRNVEPKSKNDFYERGVHYRFLPTPFYDELRTKIAKFFWRYIPFSHLFNQGMQPSTNYSRWLYWAYGYSVAMDLKQQQCDIIHVQHCLQYIPIIRACNPRTKIVLQLHGELLPQSNFVILDSWLRDVDLVTTVSNFLTEKTCKTFPQIANRCQTTYNGINPHAFIREKNYSIGKNRQIKSILYAGAVAPFKGIHVLLDAFKIVVQSYPDVRLEIVGPMGKHRIEETWPLDNKALIASVRPLYSESYMSLLQKKLSQDIASKVLFPGAVSHSQLIEKYLDADIFAFPSIWEETFGLPPVEAMAAGIPVVVTRSGGMVETVEPEKTGLLVEKNDPPALAAAFLRLLKNDHLREAMGRAARERTLQLFTWEQTTETLCHHYQTLCERSDSTSSYIKLVN